MKRQSLIATLYLTYCGVVFSSNSECYLSDENGGLMADCSERFLKDIPGDLPLNVTSINMAWNQLIYVDAEVLNNYSKVTQIILAGNGGIQLKNIGYNLSKLNRVKPKRISFDYITNRPGIGLHKTIFCMEFYQQVTHLTLRANGITSIALSCFHCVPNLQFLSMAYNPIIYLDSGVPGFNNGHLGLVFNIETTPLPYNIFQRLRVLDMSSFTSQKYAYKVEWRGATIVELFLGETEKYFLKDLTVSDLNGTTFYNKIAIEKIYVRNFFIGGTLEIHRNTKDVVSLKFLDMSHYSGEVLHIEGRVPFPNLETLICRSSSFRDIDIGIFDNLNNLVELDVTGNLLGRSESKFPEIFKPLYKLQYLYLGYNEITHLPTNSFRSLVSLKNLDLSGNPLTYISVILESHSLVYLNLYDNSLKDDFLSKNTRDNLTNISRISQINIKIDMGPDLVCSCKSEEFLVWAQKSVSGFIQINNGTKCSFNEKSVPLEEATSVLQNSYECTGILVPVLVSSVIIGCVVLVVTIVLYRFRIYIKWGFYKLKHFISKNKHSPNNVGYEFDVYISVANEDLAWTKENILNYLEDTHDMSAYLYERDSLGGATIYDNIFNGIASSASVLVVLSPHFVREEMMDWELFMAVASGKSRITIIQIDEITAPDIKLSGVLKYLILPTPKVPYHTWESGTCDGAIVLSAIQQQIANSRV